MPDKKYAILTDSACDMPFAMEKEHRVDIMNFGITVDGVPYTERVDFDFDEYYDMLRSCQGVPSTAHVTVPRFLAKFEEYDDAGVDEVLYVSINAGGSATNDAAHMAARELRAARPASSMAITIVDSHCYSMAYGWFLVQAKDMLNAGQPMDEVAAWLRDIFTRVEIVLAAFSLKFMKKSGRVSAAAAIAGELLGVRPIISLNDGISQVEKKVRGDKDVLPTMVRYAQARKQDEFYGVGGTNQATIDELCALCQAEWGVKPAFSFKLGAAVATNTGPDAIAIVFMGQPRRAPDPAQSPFTI